MVSSCSHCLHCAACAACQRTVTWMAPRRCSTWSTAADRNELNWRCLDRSRWGGQRRPGRQNCLQPGALHADATPPLVRQVRIELMTQCHCRYRRTRLAALGQCLRLELRVVHSPRARYDFGLHRCPPKLRWTPFLRRGRKARRWDVWTRSRCSVIQSSRRHRSTFRHAGEENQPTPG